LLVLMMLLGASSHQRILFGKDADDSRGDLVVNDSLIVLADYVDTEFNNII
jgi:hypothetical protein